MRSYTCIICPNGCEITPSLEDGTTSFAGAICEKGRQYVLQEMSDPRRTISSLVAVDGGEQPLVSVRITTPVPKNAIDSVMREIMRIRLPAPVRSGEILVGNLLGLGCDLIATDSVAAVKKPD